jgi:uridine phosphorylase
MVFPKFRNKHLEEALFTAEDFRVYKKWKKNVFPKKMILCYSDIPLSYFKRKFKGKYSKINIYNDNDILKIGNVGFIKMAGIGAPGAAILMEELIIGGTKEFINMGTAGGLYQTGVFLCNRAVRDEGTSHHYIANSIYSYPDDSLTRRLGEALEKSKIDYQVGATWTIDAAYRETKKEIEHYKKLGVKTVEMEASALFAVAKVRGVKIASMFAVSDVLGEKWDPQFHKMDLRRTLNRMVDVSMMCLDKK